MSEQTQLSEIIRAKIASQPVFARDLGAHRGKHEGSEEAPQRPPPEALQKQTYQMPQVLGWAPSKRSKTRRPLGSQWRVVSLGGGWWQLSFVISIF